MKRAVGIAAAVLLIATGVPAMAEEKKETRIHKRKGNQQDRIAQGVKSGELTSKEAAKLEAKEARFNRKIRNQRRANGGTLTPEQKAAAEKRQDQLSGQIAKQKHDAQKQK